MPVFAYNAILILNAENRMTTLIYGAIWILVPVLQLSVLLLLNAKMKIRLMTVYLVDVKLLLAILTTSVVLASAQETSILQEYAKPATRIMKVEQDNA